jgi:arsenate reductase
MKLYGIPNCNTVKKAQDWLKSKNVAYDFHDFKKKGITAEKLSKWFNAFGWEKVINKNGLTFKKLSKEEQAQINSAEKATAYLLQNTSAIKRPIVEQNGNAVLLGFAEEAYGSQISASSTSNSL